MHEYLNIEIEYIMYRYKHCVCLKNVKHKIVFNRFSQKLESSLNRSILYIFQTILSLCLIMIMWRRQNLNIYVDQRRERY